jgi:hypothetical protein
VKQAIGLLEARRLLRLLMLLMVAVLVMSMAGLNDADAKKKHHRKKSKNPPASLRLIQCNDPLFRPCFGTLGPDYLLGTNQFDDLEGLGGNDIYDGKGGGDNWFDSSFTSNDYYYVSVRDFSRPDGPLWIRDGGGSNDILDLSAFYRSSDFVSIPGLDIDRDGTFDDTLLDGPGVQDLAILNDAILGPGGVLIPGSGFIEQIRFSNTTLTEAELQSLVATEAFDSERAAAQAKVASSGKTMPEA